MQIFILTSAWSMDALYGSTLIFKTLRIGFPSAKVTIVDNASVPGARMIIEGLAMTHGCKYVQLENRVAHYQFIEWVVNNNLGPVALLDGDICLWENCEGWSFGDRLYAGRYIPKFRDEFTQTITEERVHPSFVWIDDCEKLRSEIEKIKDKYFCFLPFHHQMFKSPDTSEWHFQDTLGLLYQALKERVSLFTEKELSAYDHLFAGSYYSLLLETINNKQDRELLRKTHDLGKTDFMKLKGIWKLQNDYFRRRAVD